jgi:transposase
MEPELENIDRCCGLDVHKKTVVASRISPNLEGQPERQLQTFGTTTSELRKLAAWLKEVGCTHVAMESTGSYWKPVYNILEDEFVLVVVNSQHLKHLPRRKSDVRDADHIATLLHKNLLRGSAIPSRAERELRELTRYQTSLVRERADEINRVQKVLEGANIKLASVATNVAGVSGRRILEAMVAGTDDPRLLASLAHGRLQKKEEALAEALLGSIGAHQRFLLGQMLDHIKDLDRRIAAVEAEVAERTHPFAETLERLDSIPGVGPRMAQIILAEAGTDLRHFRSAEQLASWAGLCPGTHESGGKNRSGRTPKGSPWLKAALVQAAHAAGRSHTRLGERHRRLVKRLGPRKAAIATAHFLLKLVYHLQKDGVPYDDERIRQPDPERQVREHVRRLERLGYRVTLVAAA